MFDFGKRFIDLLETSDLMMMGIKRIEKIRNEEIRARAGVANISEKIREARLRWFGHVERKTEEDVVPVMRRWKRVDSRQIGKPKLRWSDVNKKWVKTGESVDWKLDAPTPNRKRPKKKSVLNLATLDSRPVNCSCLAGMKQCSEKHKEKTERNVKQRWFYLHAFRTNSPTTAICRA